MSLRITKDLRSIQAAVDELDRRTRVLKGEGGPIPIRSDIYLKDRRIRTSRKAVSSTDVPNKSQIDTSILNTSTTVVSQGGAAGWLRMNQSLTGTMDGANKAFTLPHTLMSGSEPVIYHNFTRLQKVTNTNPGNTEYYRSGQSIKLGLAPASGDTVTVDQMTPKGPNPILDEEPDGTKNYSNTSFTLAYEPTAPADVALYHGSTRVTLTYGTPGENEFSLSGRTITMGTAPRATEVLRADYTARRFGDIHWGDELEGIKNGLNTIFTLDETPYASEIAIYFNGIRLEEVASSPTVTEYTRVGDTVTLGLAPNADSPLYADYVTPYGGQELHLGPGWWIGTECGDMIATTRSEFEQV